MAVIQLMHKNEVGKTTEVVDGNVEVKINNEGNVKFERTETGLKGEVALPEAKVAVTKVEIVDGKVKVTKSDETTEELPLPAQAIDVKLQSAELTEDNKLKLTLSNGDILEADLAKFVDAPKAAADYWTEIKALPDFKATVIDLIKSPEAKAALLEMLKGDEVQNLSGETKGYLLAK
jgi:hypothetical protein|nr:MAG TPA: Heat shock protein beta-1, ALA-LEU-SER-ARG-GLN-fold, sHSP, CHAPERONE.1A [Caudoviricetes sp.]